MKFSNQYGEVEVLKNKKLSRNKVIGLSMSGGADSTLLCVLVAKTIDQKGLNSIIQPYNGYDTWAPLDSAGLPKIITYIRTLFPNVRINWPVSVVFDTNGDHEKDKNTYIRPFVHNLINREYVDFIIPGISSGPPIEVQEKFGIKDHTAIQRIPGYRLWNEVENANDKRAPFKNVDKRFMLQCYKDFGLKELFDMTQSCTHPAGNCGKCWWCKEREWASQEVFGE